MEPKSNMFVGLNVAALLSVATAFDANVYGGSWEMVVGSTGQPPTQSYGHATLAPGYLLVRHPLHARTAPRETPSLTPLPLLSRAQQILANDTSAVAGPSGAVDLWRYNVIKNTWAK